MKRLQIKKVKYLLLFIMILVSLVGCQPTPPQRGLPTRFVVPSPTPVALLTLPPPSLPATVTASMTMTSTALPATPTAALTPSSSPTDLPAQPPPALTLLPTATVPPNIAASTLPEHFIFGKSASGRDLFAYRIGQGGIVILLVGGIHAGAEENTIALLDELVAHFQRTPDAVLPGLTLLFVPVLNPDGAAYGRVNRGRFNGNGVDLNRNWGCNWQATAYFREEEVYPGDRPFSEPETVSLGALINDTRPAAVLFYHGAANGVYAGSCKDSRTSQPLAAIIGAATGYPYTDLFVEYSVTGDAANWVDSMGISAVDVELASDTATEFTRNLRGVMALQCALVGADAAASIASCNP